MMSVITILVTQGLIEGGCNSREILVREADSKRRPEVNQTSVNQSGSVYVCQPDLFRYLGRLRFG